MKWNAKVLRYNKESRIAVYFEKNADLILRIKKLEGSRWSQSLCVWHLPDTSEHRERFNLPLHTNSIPSPEGIAQIEKFKQWLRSKRYSESTLTTYSEALKSFLLFYREKTVAEITNDDVIVYNNEYLLKNNLSASYQNQIVNALKLYFKTVRETKIDIDRIHRPKRAKALPNVLSKEEVKAILEAHSNIKHKTMLSLIYSCGLRRSELLNLKPTDIDSKRNIVIIRQSKGKKDRIVPLSYKILEMLRDYYKGYKPKKWLFEGKIETTQYDERSVANVLKQALAKANIKKPVSLHWLRHSYATHLLESGTDLRYIQELLSKTEYMDFNNLSEIKNAGFVGFKTMQELFLDSSQLPVEKGVYLVLNLDTKHPTYLPIGSGGYFKGKNPNVTIEELKNNWIEKTLIVYIGKATSLRSRLRQYFGFGQGKNIGHYGGRYIWQLASSKNLVVCWKTLPNDDSRIIEAELISNFKKQFGNRPFANLVD